MNCFKAILSLKKAGIPKKKSLMHLVLVKSPGIPEKNELIKELREREIEIISEIEFAYRYKGSSKIIAITGSNGKTTTTAMIYHICKTAGMDCAMVGNIGYSLQGKWLIEPKKLYVIEVSSFQLDDIKSFQARCSSAYEYHRRSFRQV